jgi:hypothetical protein
VNKLSARITILFLAALFLCGNLLHYPFYRFAVAQAKAEIRREMFGPNAEEAKSAVMLTFTAQEFERYAVEEHELNVNGQWYDIISSETAADGTVKVKCFSDTKESLLQAWFERVNDENSSDHGAPVKNAKHAKQAMADCLTLDFYDLVINEAPSIPVGSSSFVLDLSNGHTNQPELPPRA